jgi:hypothetical protein
VLLQDPKTKRWFTPGIIVETGNHRDYLVKTPAGRLFRRNRRLIKRVPVMPGPGPAAALPQAGTSQPLDAKERSNPARPVQTEQPAESTRPGIGRKEEDAQHFHHHCYQSPADHHANELQAVVTLPPTGRSEDKRKPEDSHFFFFLSYHVVT